MRTASQKWETFYLILFSIKKIASVQEAQKHKLKILI